MAGLWLIWHGLLSATRAGLSLFVYWRSKLTKVSTDPSGKTDAESQAPSAFVAVRSQPLPRSTEVSGDDLHLRLPNGLEIRNIYHSNLDHVRSLLECL